ncbi:MAG: PQQ-binding-like beta-propeller repeat protein [Gemmatimonadetes bacterium]|nr:PQQ-binding-like beta-propeller repeat protein [Gemmatimonadota bacterium]
MFVLCSAARVTAQEPAGATLFEVQCAACHTPPGVPRAPTLETLRDRAPGAIVAALTDGIMALQGQNLTDVERRAVAEFITGRAVSDDAIGTSAGLCESTPTLVDPLDGPHWSGWGVGRENLRFQTAESAGLDFNQVPNLTLKWAFGFPETTSAWAQPAVAGGRLFVGSQNGDIYALDAKTGCGHWTYSARTGVRTAISVGALGDGHALYFGDTGARVYAIDAQTGAELWSRDVESHPGARITGAPTLHEGRLYVPVSSIEEVLASDPGYGCCTFRGSVVVLDAATGDQIWKTYTIPAEPVARGTGPNGTTLSGPAGAAVWGAPTIDAGRGLVYVATGNAYTQPAAETSDAIVAFDLDTGEIRWFNQLTPEDAFILGCGGDNPNCPEDEGPDHDFGASPALVTMTDGSDLLVIGQKSGMTYGLDPDRAGRIVWEYRAGAGSALGGIEWGFAVDGDNAYFANSDVITPNPGGLSAVRLRTGELVWYAEPPPPICAGAGVRSGFMSGCDASLPAAVSVIPGVVFSGSNDGGLRAHSAESGEVIWIFDTNREFDTVNGVPASGGSLNAGGPVIVDGMVYVNSGYAFMGSRGGNVLLAFGLP